MNSLGLAAAKRGAAAASFDTQLYGEGKISASDPPVIRVPQLFSFPYVTGTQDDQFSNAPVAATELNPPNMQIPALKATWRGYKPNAGGINWPIYLYLAQQPAGQSVSLLDGVMAQANKAFPGKPTPWEDISFVAQDGVTQVPYKKLTVNADMAFGVPPGTEPATAPSTLLFFVHNSNGWEVLVGVRIPDELDKELKFTVDTLALALGSLKTAP